MSDKLIGLLISAGIWFFMIGMLVTTAAVMWSLTELFNIIMELL